VTTPRGTRRSARLLAAAMAGLGPPRRATNIRELPDGRLKVAVHQVVKDKQGVLVFEDPVKHLYTLQDGLLLQMDIDQG
jgi:hypothetical protein